MGYVCCHTLSRAMRCPIPLKIGTNHRLCNAPRCFFFVYWYLKTLAKKSRKTIFGSQIGGRFANGNPIVKYGSKIAGKSDLGLIFGQETSLWVPHM